MHGFELSATTRRHEGGREIVLTSKGLWKPQVWRSNSVTSPNITEEETAPPVVTAHSRSSSSQGSHRRGSMSSNMLNMLGWERRCYRKRTHAKGDARYNPFRVAIRRARREVEWYRDYLCSA